MANDLWWRTRLVERGAVLLARSASDRRATMSGRRAIMSNRSGNTTEPLPMTCATTMNASEWPATCSDLVAILQATKTPSTSPTLESEATLETLLRRLRGRVKAVATPPTHMNPASIGFQSCSCRREASTSLRGRWTKDRRLQLKNLHVDEPIDSPPSFAGNSASGGG